MAEEEVIIAPNASLAFAPEEADASASDRSRAHPACGTPPRPRQSSGRCRQRERTPSPPRPCWNLNKSQRSVSPGGTAAGSAVEARRTSERRVSWAQSLVDAVHTRPRTLRVDVASLFYSKADERRFRQEASSPQGPDHDEFNPGLHGNQGPDGEVGHRPLWSAQRGDRAPYSISKAVVIFGSQTRTYGSGCVVSDLEDARPDPTSSPSAGSPRDIFSFDDAAFWNGQLTWS